MLSNDLLFLFFALFIMNYREMCFINRILKDDIHLFKIPF